jgi:hypothetical protein
MIILPIHMCKGRLLDSARYSLHLVDFSSMFDEMDSELLLGTVDRLEDSIVANSQLEQAAPVAGKWLRC